MSIFHKRADLFLLGALQKPGQPRMATPWNWLKRMLKRSAARRSRGRR
jgi:hypothetical protein